MKTNPVARALVSVSDKRGIVAFCRGLAALNIEILSTGGTARQLGENGIAVTEVSAYTGFPEMMDGRVKTLHPKIHGAILGRRGVDDEVMAAHDIRAIDLVAVNLYPFEETVAEPGCKLEQAIESIDIGGPALLRAAAKNHRDTTVLVDPEDYGAVLEHLQRKQRRVPAPLRFDLAVKAFEHTAGYDGAIANHLGARMDARGRRCWLARGAGAPPPPPGGGDWRRRGAFTRSVVQSFNPCWSSFLRSVLRLMPSTLDALL